MEIKLKMKLKKFVKKQPIYGIQYKGDKDLAKKLNIKHNIFYSKKNSLNYFLNEDSWIVSDNPNFLNDLKHSDIWVIDDIFMKNNYTTTK